MPLGFSPPDASDNSTHSEPGAGPRIGPAPCVAGMNGPSTRVVNRVGSGRWCRHDFPVARTWNPSSWRGFPAAQQPEWPDDGALERALKQINAYPPLVFAGEARSLMTTLGHVAAGNAFLLQAGDCAESFDEFSAVNIREKLRVILQMAVVPTYSLGVPCVKGGRIAGQFAKPRSAPIERVGDDDLPVFRGHMVNDPAPTLAARQPDPDRLVQAYHQSASTLNLLRAFTKGGFADLTRVHQWTQEF